MKRSRVLLVLACLLGGVLSQGLIGCAHQESTMTPADKANFKGGPMPASAAKIMAEKMRQANAPQPAPASTSH